MSKSKSLAQLSDQSFALFAGVFFFASCRSTRGHGFLATSRAKRQSSGWPSTAATAATSWSAKAASLFPLGKGLYMYIRGVMSANLTHTPPSFSGVGCFAISFISEGQPVHVLVVSNKEGFFINGTNCGTSLDKVGLIFNHRSLLMTT